MESDSFIDLETQSLVAWRSLLSHEASFDPQRLGLPVERALWMHWDADDNTKGFWEDGVSLASLERVGDRKMALGGAIWCADHRQQWLVPAQVLLEINEAGDGLLRATIRFGDGTSASLRDHGARPHGDLPETWLCSVEIEPPRSSQEKVTTVLLELRAWLHEHPEGKVVDPDWELVSPEAAEDLIIRHAKAGCLPVLKSTWLDGNAAMWVSLKA